VYQSGRGGPWEIEPFHIRGAIPAFSQRHPLCRFQLGKKKVPFMTKTARGRGPRG
jgi:hypothetical protein